MRELGGLAPRQRLGLQDAELAPALVGPRNYAAGAPAIVDPQIVALQQELGEVMGVGNAAAGVALAGATLAVLMARPAFAAVANAALEVLHEGFGLTFQQAYGVLVLLVYILIFLTGRNLLQRRREYMGRYRRLGGGSISNLDAVLQNPKIQTFMSEMKTSMFSK